METIKIKPPFIKLEQFLKYASVAETGGMAKQMILDGIVHVNGEPCTMRGKKLVNGDRVSVFFEEGTEELLCTTEE